jgi:alanyl-tRNA synthetase
MSSDRLYYTDAYRTSFEARVVERADEGRRVYLEHTAFYPTSGGQPHDVGTLGGTPVVDVIDEGARVAHVLAGAAPDAEILTGEIDWQRRYDHMQQHTGQHLLSAVFEDLFGHHTVSVHFGDEYSTLDLDIESVSRERLVQAEERANEIVTEGRRVVVSFEDAATAAGLRKASDREGTLRIVSIEGIDRSACGGTHVRTTSEIGTVLVRRVEKVRKATRIEFVCGSRALRRARTDFDALTQVAGALSTSLDEAPALVAAQAAQLRDGENARRKLERELAAFRARALHESTPPNERGHRVAVVRDSAGMEELRALAQAYVALPGAVIVGVVQDPPALLFGAAEDTGLDAGRTLRDVVTPLGGRGGGSPRVAQGSVPSDALEACVSALAESKGVRVV